MRILVIAFFLLFTTSAFCDEAYLDTETGLSFPQQIGAFQFLHERDYGSPDLGYGLNYGSKSGIFITVIVYDLGVKGISDGVSHSFVGQQFKQAQDDIEQRYTSVHKLQTPITTTIPFLKASYTYVDTKGTQKVSHLFIRGQANKIIKIRATALGKDSIDSQLSQFMNPLSEAISNASAQSCLDLMKIESPKFFAKCIKDADSGDAAAQYFMGNMYLTGISKFNIQQDYILAKKYYEMALNQNLTLAAGRLGLIYHQGLGTKVNVKKAISLYSLASSQDCEAAYNLGMMKYRGEETPVNYTEARELFIKSTNKGCSKAHWLLSWMYFNGHGVKVDNIQGYKEAFLAANLLPKTHPDQPKVQQLLQTAEKEMSKEDIQEAKNIAGKYLRDFLSNEHLFDELKLLGVTQ